MSSATSPLGIVETVHHPRRTAGGRGSKRLSHQGSAWRANERAGCAATGVKEGRGGSFNISEVTVPRSVHRKTGNENKNTCANMQIKTKPKKKHHRTTGAPIREIHGLLLPVARRRQRTAGRPEKRGEKRPSRAPLLAWLR